MTHAALTAEASSAEASLLKSLDELQLVRPNPNPNLTLTRTLT